MPAPAGNPNLPVKKPKPKRWRDLTDEQQWKRIYQDRAAQRRTAPQTVRQAVALGLPSYVMHEAVSDCHKTLQATVRGDVHHAIVSGIAKVASLMQEGDREPYADMLHREYLTIKRAGFYLDNREFLYANACALVRLVDEVRYPADAPAVMAALLLKSDAEEYDEGDWRLAMGHAIRMTGVAYDQFMKTGMYSTPDEIR